jgi:hypothetical protein
MIEEGVAAGEAMEQATVGVGLAPETPTTSPFSFSPSPRLKSVPGRRPRSTILPPV